MEYCHQDRSVTKKIELLMLVHYVTSSQKSVKQSEYK